MTGLSAKHFLLRCLVVILAITVVPAIAQPLKASLSEINFQDLQRPGKPAVKVYSIKGLQHDANQWFSNFSDIDASERREIASAMASSSSSSVSDSSSANSSTRQSSDTRIWRCKVYCKSAGGPVTWKEVSAQTRREAARWIDQNADAICNAAGYRFSSSIAFPENQCSEK